MHAMRWAIAAIACVIWATPCRPSDSVTGLLACRAIADAGARLACFDREAAALAPRTPTAAAPASAPAAPASAPAAATPANTPTAATPPPPAPVLNPQQQFGLPEHSVIEKEVAAGTRAADAKKIEAHITQFTTAADGRIVFTLDNDQVWKQLLSEGSLLARQGDAVTVSRGVLGSFWLQLANGRGCKVTRLR